MPHLLAHQDTAAERHGPGRQFQTAMHEMGRKVPKEYLNLWPYAREQCERLPIVLERFKGWRLLFSEFIRFFEAVKKIENKYAAEYNRFGSALLPPNNSHSPVPHVFAMPDNILSPITLNLQQLGSAHAGIATFIGERVLRRLKALRHQVVHYGRHYEKHFEHLVAEVMQHRKHTLQVLTHSRKFEELNGPFGMSGFQDDGADFGPRTSTNQRGVDPFIMHLRAKAQLQKMINAENVFQETVLHQHREIAQIDAGIFDTMRDVLDQFLAFSMTQGGQGGNTMAAMRGMLAQTDAFGPFVRFAETFEILTHPHFTTIRTVDTFPYSPGTIGIEKQGILCRAGIYRKANWKPLIAILTETGWLHCFDIKTNANARRAGSFNGNQVGAVGRQASLTRNPSELIQPGLMGDMRQASQVSLAGNPTCGNGVSRLASMGMSSDDLMTHLLSSGVGTNMEKSLKPMSINLASPRISVVPNERKFHQHVFTVMSEGRKSGLFKMGGGIVKLELRATTEGDMIDWISALQRKAELYLPIGPPAPIFRSPHELSAELERRRTQEHRGMPYATAAENQYPIDPGFMPTRLGANPLLAGQPRNMSLGQISNRTSPSMRLRMSSEGAIPTTQWSPIRSGRPSRVPLPALPAESSLAGAEMPEATRNGTYPAAASVVNRLQQPELQSAVQLDVHHTVATPTNVPLAEQSNLSPQNQATGLSLNPASSDDAALVEQSTIKQGLEHAMDPGAMSTSLTEQPALQAEHQPALSTAGPAVQQPQVQPNLEMLQQPADIAPLASAADVDNPLTTLDRALNIPLPRTASTASEDSLQPPLADLREGPVSAGVGPPFISEVSPASAARSLPQLPNALAAPIHPSEPIPIPPAIPAASPVSLSRQTSTQGLNPTTNPMSNMTDTIARVTGLENTPVVPTHIAAPYLAQQQVKMKPSRMDSFFKPSLLTSALVQPFKMFMKPPRANAATSQSRATSADDMLPMPGALPAAVE
ncbi:hypothetical protein DFS34DRAFT_692141 [Phlyctochytrium arcticum]|nr:hypothetical protein DFS34DRAFT_692141 [Phlyctochytrium arcticum]